MWGICKKSYEGVKSLRVFADAITRAPFRMSGNQPLEGGQVTERHRSGGRQHVNGHTTSPRGMLLRAVLYVVSTLVVLMSVHTPSADAVYSHSLYDTNHVVTDGRVEAITPDGAGGHYLGGSFQLVGYRSGSGVIRTGAGLDTQIDTTRFNGTVYASASDGASGWYVGGNFTSVNGADHFGLVHLLPDGRVDPAFDWQPVTGAGNVVKAIEVTANYIVVGGMFNGVQNPPSGTPAIQNLLVIDRASNTIKAAPSVSGSVNALTWNGASSKMWIGTSSGSGGLSAFDPGAAFPTLSTPVSTPGNVYAIERVGDFMIVGGAFSTPKPRLFAVDAATGTVQAGWNPNPSGDVLALKADSLRLYIGGRFSTIAGTTRNFIAAADLANASALPVLNASWVPSLPLTGGAPEVDAIETTGTSIYIGGSFRSFRRDTQDYLYTVDKSSASGAQLSVSNELAANGVVQSLSFDGSNMFMGGSFTATGNTRHVGSAHVMSDGSVDASWNIWTNDEVDVIHVQNGTVYLGGKFNYVDINPPLNSSLMAWGGGTSSNGIAAVNPSGSASVPVPALSAGYQVRDLAQGASVNELLVLAEFTVAGLPQWGVLKAFDLSLNTITGTRTAKFELNAVAGADVTDLVYDTSVVPARVYVAGTFDKYTFSDLTARTQAGLASFEDDPANVAKFRHRVWTSPFTSGASVRTIALHPTDTTKLFVGGAFVVGTNSNLIAVNRSTGTQQTFAFTSNGAVNAILGSGASIYVGGAFTTAKGVSTAGRVVEIATTGTMSDWRAGPDGDVLTMAVDGAKLHIGGTFMGTDSGTGESVATYAAPTAVPPSPTALMQARPDMSPIAAGTWTPQSGAVLRMNLAATDVPQGVRVEFYSNSAYAAPAVFSYDLAPMWRSSPSASIPLIIPVKGQLPDAQYWWRASTYDPDHISTAGPWATAPTSGSPARAFGVDTAPPNAPVTAPGNGVAGTSQWLNTQTVKIQSGTDSGSGIVEHQLCVTDPGDAVGANCATVPWGTWNVAAPSTSVLTGAGTNLVSGSSYRYCQRERDAAGLLSPVTCATAPFIWDITAPPQPTTTLTGGTPVTGTHTIVAYASDPESGVNKIDFSFSPDGIIWTTPVPATWNAGASNWSYVWNTSSLPNGDYHIRMSATNNVGMTSPSLDVTPRIDNQPPSISVSPTSADPYLVWVSGTNTVFMPPSNTLQMLNVNSVVSDNHNVSMAGRNVSFGSMSGTFSGASFVTPGGSALWSSGGNSWTYPIAPNGDTHASLTVSTSDAASNAASRTISVHTDSLLPSSSITGVTSVSSLPNETLDITATEAAGGAGTPQSGIDMAATSVSVDNLDDPNPVTGACTTSGNPRHCTLDDSVNTDGRYRFDSIAFDKVHNGQSTPTTAYTYFDHLPPTASGLTVTATGPGIYTTGRTVYVRQDAAPDATSSFDVNVSVNAADATSGVQSLDFGAGLNCNRTYTLGTRIAAPASCTYHVPYAQGAADYPIVITDHAGLVGPTTVADAQMRVRLDASAPTATAPVVSNSGSVFTYSGTFSDGATGVASWNLQYRTVTGTTWTNIASSATPGATSWSASWDTSLIADGDYAIRLVALDGVGNTLVQTVPDVSVNNNPAPAQPSIPVIRATPGSDSPQLRIDWDPNADEALSAFEIRVRPAADPSRPGQLFRVPAGVAMIPVAGAPAYTGLNMPKGTDIASFTLLNGMPDTSGASLTLTPGSAYLISIVSFDTTSLRSTEAANVPPVVIPRSIVELSSYQLAGNDATRGCGDLEHKCTYEPGQRIRVSGLALPPQLTDNATLSVLVYQKSADGTWRLDDERPAATINDGGWISTFANGLGAGTYRVVIRLRESDTENGAEVAEYMSVG